MDWQAQDRMPELFCGFPKQPGEGLVLYPVACAPTSLVRIPLSLLNESIEDHPQSIFMTFLWTFYPIFMSSVLA
jgi:hypothetical protein